MKKTSLQTKPYMLDATGPRFRSLEALVRILASTEQTGGAFNLFDVICPGGYETPLHIHYAEDVAIQILEGSLEMFRGEEQQRAEACSFFFQPRGTPHGFRVMGKSPARISYMTLPAGFDGFVIEHSHPITAQEKVISETHYQIEVLGPLPLQSLNFRKGKSK